MDAPQFKTDEFRMLVMKVSCSEVLPGRRLFLHVECTYIGILLLTPSGGSERIQLSEPSRPAREGLEGLHILCESACCQVSHMSGARSGPALLEALLSRLGTL